MKSRNNENKHMEPIKCGRDSTLEDLRSILDGSLGSQLYYLDQI